MPTYEFRCFDCPTIFKERRTFAQADEVAICPACQSERTRKVLNMPQVFSRGKSTAGQGQAGARMPHGLNCFCCPPRIKF
ncbi:MAG TPA: zinc ribbon domain-containing protein [Anaerolineae bacterium]|nr:zinc ribbon domain-containing protein [Anaerolineae bacterium]